ncbi:MAG: hypothetical protein ACRC1M_05785 [Methanobacteriaceae archaeon]
MKVLQNFKHLEIADDLKAIDESKDHGGGSYLEKPINPQLANFLYLKNYLLASSIEIFQEDVVMNNIIKVNSESKDVSDIMETLNNHRDEISYMYGDYKLYGAGACKIIRTETGFVLNHLPQDQLNIKKVNINGKLYPLVEQVIDYTVQSTEDKNKLFLLHNISYPKEIIASYKIEGVLLWIGKSRSYNYYTVPFYIQNVPDMRNGIIIDALDEEQLKQGNNTNGVLILSKSGVKRLKSNDGSDDSDDAPIMPSNVQTVKTALEKGGIGNAMLYDESDTPLTATYVSLSNSNNDYLDSKIEQLKNSIISRSKIPRERYMINDIKEPMNSQKTMAFWSIYNVFASSEQTVLEKILVDLINFLYVIDDVEVDMTTPIFEEIVSLSIEETLRLLNEGMITYGGASTEINRVKPSVPIISESDGRYNQYKDVASEDIDLTGLTS